MREVPQKSRPVVDFKQHISQWQMWQQGIDALFQTLDFFGHRFFQLRKVKMSFFIQGQAPFDLPNTLL